MSCVVLDDGRGMARPRLREVRAVVFDVTGTLLEPREPIGATYARVAAAHGIELDPLRAQRAFAEAIAQAPPLAFPGLDRRERSAAERDWWRAIVERVVAEAAGVGPGAAGAVSPTKPTGPAGIGASRFAELFGALYDGFAHPSAWRPLPDAAATLAALSGRGYTLGVLSNFDGRLPGLLEGTGLARHFDAIVTSVDAGAAKPDPRAFHAVLARLDAEPGQAAYVGDSVDADAAGAAAAGLVPILLASEPVAGVDAVHVSRLADLSALLPGPAARTEPPARTSAAR